MGDYMVSTMGLGGMVIPQQKPVVTSSQGSSSSSSSKAVQSDGNISNSSNQGSNITDLNSAANSALTGDDSSSSSRSKSSSGLLDGDMTFEELIGEICNGIDLIFVVKRSTVVVTDYESIYAEAKYLRDNYQSNVKNEDISLWQLADGSYEFDIQDYGFYTTVEVNYKNGTVKESFEDLVRVFGEVKITYDEPNIDKTTAIMKAKAYLAAHMREFEVTVHAEILHDGDIDIGDIVTLENPQTMNNSIHNSRGEDSEYLFVTGNSISWDGGPITNSIELRFGPVSPDKKEVPEYGADYSGDSSSTSTGDIQSALDTVGQKWSKIGYSHNCQTADCVRQTGSGDCFGASDLIACELKALGVNTKIVQYGTAYAWNHRSVLYQDKDGTWKDFPYRTYGFNTLFNNTAASASGSPISKTCGD